MCNVASDSEILKVWFQLYSIKHLNQTKRVIFVNIQSQFSQLTTDITEHDAIEIKAPRHHTAKRWCSARLPRYIRWSYLISAILNVRLILIRAERRIPHEAKCCKCPHVQEREVDKWNNIAASSPPTPTPAPAPAPAPAPPPLRNLRGTKHGAR